MYQSTTGCKKFDYIFKTSLKFLTPFQQIFDISDLIFAVLLWIWLSLEKKENTCIDAPCSEKVVNNIAKK